MNKAFHGVLIPTLVGLTQLMMADEVLRKIQLDGLRNVLTHPYMRILALFGAAYAANGARFYTGVLALYIYHQITTRPLSQGPPSPPPSPPPPPEEAPP